MHPYLCIRIPTRDKTTTTKNNGRKPSRHSAPLSPGSVGTPRQSPTSSSAPPASAGRLASPFSRLRLLSPRRSPGGDDDPATPHDAIARDMADEGHVGAPSASPSGGPDAAASALSSYSREPPPVRFLSRRARVVSVGRRHVFPPSRYPSGKLASDPDGRPVMLDEYRTGPGGAAELPATWSSAYDVRGEGVLPSGWLEKHARALPSALLVVTAINRSDAGARVGRHCADALADLRMSMCEKRDVPVHLAVIVNEGGTAAHSARGGRVGTNAIRDGVCRDVGLPGERVTLLRYPEDLRPDSFESGILGSRYLDPGRGGAGPGGPGPATTPGPAAVMNPSLRALDRSLRDSSAGYYARLASSQERKLQLWRDRYHGTNPGFGVNTLLASMRCARYSAKAATLRELESRAGTGAAGGTRWTDRTSAPMRLYEESYRWTAELRGRCVSWRAETSAGRDAVPATPGKPPRGGGGVSSPRVTQSPGGGLGVELSLPGAPPPPPGGRHPSLSDEDGAFHARLWEQTRAVAGWLNSRLLRATSPGGVTTPDDLAGADGQWTRHATLYLAEPPGCRDGGDDRLFGPGWRRAVHAVDEMRAHSCVAEGRWRQVGRGGWGGGYHRPLAPWKAYAELCSGLLRLNGLLGGVDVEDCAGQEQRGGGGGYGKFFGCVSSSGTGVGSTRWALQCEMRKDHRGE